jgi:imidazolonepropionase-like amidohydrolase
MNITNIELGMRTLRKGLKSLRVACGILAALTSPAAFAQQKVDTVVTNGKILTVDADFRVVEAFAINDGRIVARGTSAKVARYAGPNTKVIDVKGATVIPGLIDNHFHFTRAVERWQRMGQRA